MDARSYPPHTPNPDDSTEPSLELDPNAPPASSLGAAAGSVAQRLKTLLWSAQGGDARSLARAAAALGMSSRTLQRRLQQEGTTFRAVLDAIGLERARLLQSGVTTARALAASLGFSEAAAFHRAFKRWTGTTPRKFAWDDGTSAAPPASGVEARDPDSSGAASGIDDIERGGGDAARSAAGDLDLSGDDVSGDGERDR